MLKIQHVDAHNAARSEVGVPDLAWDDSVAAYAENYANQRKGDCALIHSGGEYGENIAMSTGELSGTDAVKMWVDEKANYDHDSNSCVGGECLHYTQVVWRDSVRLGCAKVTCDNGGTFITCNYDPPGNFVVPLAVVFSAWIVFRKESLRDLTLIAELPDMQVPGLPRSIPSNKLIFPLMALLAGMLGGVFGIGGNSSNMFFHASLFCYHVSIAISIVGNGT
ncbi:Pathogenesis-related protein 1 [Glycine soja]|uniref:Pathogenesis-related protein 1 n=1 Tax=Glycine soja TaxID=3848 RepID=A0A445GQ14_GLYSO|nr:Pathogenesis-related protein 1 [Glycine soja]